MTCNSKLYAIGGYDGTCNLSSVEFYDPETNQWTLVASMGAHEGVVGVGVLPDDVDLGRNSEEENERSFSCSVQVPFKVYNGGSNQSSFANSVNKPLMKNYYSLMEEEEEENQFQSMINQNTNFIKNQ